MKTLEGTMIIMNDGERIFVNHSKDEINRIIDEAISIKRNYITIAHLDRDIYFNYIKDKFSKTRHLALPEPKKQKKLFEMGSKERKNFRNENSDKYYEMERQEEKDRIVRKKMMGEMLEKTYEGRKKNFFNQRKEILRELAKREKVFDLQTTIEKLEELNNFRKIKIKNMDNDVYDLGEIEIEGNINSVKK